MSASLLLAATVRCFVGCNVGSPDLQAIHVLSCDTDTGAAKIVQSVRGLRDTTYFQVDREGRYLYGAMEERRDGRKGSAIVRFPLTEGRLGDPERLAELPCEAPCHVALTRDERRVAFAAYGSALAGTVGVDGTDLRTVVLPNDGMGPNTRRQKKAYAHQTFNWRPEGASSDLLGVVDLGCDRIRFFDPLTMAVASVPDIRFDAGDGPRHAIWSKDGRFLFVVCELGSCVYSFACRGRTFVRVGKWTMLPDDFREMAADGFTRASWASAIKLTADGKLLMASNRGCDSIAFFGVGEDGTLKLRSIAELAGKFPRDFELLPGERFMVVGHERSDDLRVYRFDRAACMLTPAGPAIPAWHPLCFKFEP